MLRSRNPVRWPGVAVALGGTVLGGGLCIWKQGIQQISPQKAHHEGDMQMRLLPPPHTFSQCTWGCGLELGCWAPLSPLSPREKGAWSPAGTWGGGVDSPQLGKGNS